MVIFHSYVKLPLEDAGSFHFLRQGEEIKDMDDLTLALFRTVARCPRKCTVGVDLILLTGFIGG